MHQETAARAAPRPPVHPTPRSHISAEPAEASLHVPIPVALAPSLPVPIPVALAPNSPPTALPSASLPPAAPKRRAPAEAQFEQAKPPPKPVNSYITYCAAEKIRRHEIGDATPCECPKPKLETVGQKWDEYTKGIGTTPALK